MCGIWNHLRAAPHYHFTALLPPLPPAASLFTLWIRSPCQHGLANCRPPATSLLCINKQFLLYIGFHKQQCFVTPRHCSVFVTVTAASTFQASLQGAWNKLKGGTFCIVVPKQRCGSFSSDHTLGTGISELSLISQMVMVDRLSVFGSCLKSSCLFLFTVTEAPAISQNSLCESAHLKQTSVSLNLLGYWRSPDCQQEAWWIPQNDH